MMMAQDAMRGQGYSVDSANFNQPELAVQAISQGETQFSSGSTYTVMQAIQKGAKIKLIADSDQRGAAMLAGQLDASPLQLDSQVTLYKKGPGKFHTLADFSKDLPQLDTSAIYVSDDFLSKNRPAVVDFVVELIKANRAVSANPQLLKENNTKFKLGGDDVIDDVTKAYLGINAFDKNGGVTEQRMTYSIDFFTKANQLKPGLKPSDVADLSIVKDALAKVG
jgi:NitT/TauT family transport system substrate-binding protein